MLNKIKWVTFIKMGKVCFPNDGNNLPIITQTIRMVIGLKKAIHLLYFVPPFKIAKIKVMDNRAIIMRNALTNTSNSSL